MTGEGGGGKVCTQVDFESSGASAAFLSVWKRMMGLLVCVSSLGQTDKQTDGHEERD